MKNIIPNTCPNCHSELKVKKGKKDNIYKLICPNIECQGSVLKKLSKSVEILDIKELGPKTIEKLHEAVGIKNIVDLFNFDKITKNNLVNSGYFKDNKNLDNIINSLRSISELRIDNFIHSLQIDYIDSNQEVIPIGSSLSYQIGRYLSNLDYDFEGLSKEIRKDVFNNNSRIIDFINKSINKLENNNIKIKYIEDNKNKVEDDSYKKVEKKVCFDVTNDYSDILDKLNWEEINVESADLLIVDDKNQNTKKVKIAKKNDIKIITLKQLKILFL